MNEVKIDELLNNLTAKFKAAKVKPGGEVYKSVDWGMLYQIATAHAEEIEVHACGDFPVKLLQDTFPNETKEEQQYRNKTFQPITEPYWKKAIRTINRVWSEQNYSLKWNDEDAEKYFTKEYPMFGNVLHYFKSVVTQSKINDPNGLLVLDFELPVREIAEGELEIDQSKEVSPYGTIYKSCDVLMMEDNDFALVMSEEKSPIQFGNTTQKIGYVMYLYDEENVYRIEQIGKKIDWTFKYSIYYPHQLGYLPCWKLQGTPEKVINDEVLYDSHFSPAIPYLNEAIIIHSTLKASISKIAYPIRAYYEQKCNAAGCQNGMTYEADNTPKKCSSCNGTGMIKFSPLRDYIHELPTTTTDITNFPGIQYVSPDSTILDFSKSTIDDWIQKAFLFLNIDAVPDGMKAGVGGDATATKSKIDREEQFVSLLDISNELYSLLHKFLIAAYQVRYNKQDKVELSPPKTFELTTASELTDELKAAKEGQLPDIAIGELTADYIAQRFSQKSKIGRIADAARYCDPLFTKTAVEISIYQSGGNLQKWEVILHMYIFSFLSEILKDGEIADMEVLKTKVIELAKAKAAESENNTADNILNGIAGGA